MIQDRRTLAGVLTWIGLVVLVSFVAIAILAPFISPYPAEGPSSVFLTPPNQPPSLNHLMGTDALGRDVFSRVLWGAQTSLAVMAIGVIFALVVGFPVGLISGYLGGIIDRIILLVMDSVYAFPGLLLAALVAVMLGKGVLNIGLAITVIYVPLYYRVTRNQTLSVREETYVEAAKGIGATPLTIMGSYIAYNVLVTIPVIFALSAADAILTAAGLSYLGLGIERPTPDWGLDLSDAQQFLGLGVWWTSFFPGLMIILLTVGLSFLGEGLNDLINPLLRKRGT
jgi:peptide/nickel transport system permease protein